MFGGGAGTIQDMINRVKDNRALLKKREYFKKRKQELSSVHFQEDTPPISDEVLEYELNINRKYHRYNRVRSLIYFIFILLFMGAILIAVAVSIP